MPIGMDNHRKLGGSNGDSVQLDSTVGGRIGHYEHEFKKSNEEKAQVSPSKHIQPSVMSAEVTPETVRLPATFAVKFLGKREARGLWGIKYTRQPVDEMVSLAKSLKPGTSLPHLHFKVDVDGVTVSEMPENRARGSFEVGFYSVDSISYGVQDLIYTRVFSMIVVKSEAALSPAALMAASAGTSSTAAMPFECYAYVCDSRQSARQLTIALATAFQEFSKSVKSQKVNNGRKRIAIDLRTPEEMMAAETEETEA